MIQPCERSDHDSRKRPRPKSRRRSAVLYAQVLEQRTLLSTASLLFSKFNVVRYGSAAYIITLNGPGAVTTHKSRTGGVDINLFGTTQDSQVSITTLNSRSHSTVTPLAVDSIRVRSSRVGSILGLTSADLDGPISPLQGPVNSLQFNSIGQASQIDVEGNLGQLSVNHGIALGPRGYLDVANDVTGPFSVLSDVTLRGGSIQIGRDMAGAVNIGGSWTVDDGGMFSVGRNIGGTSVSTATTSPTAGGAATTTSSGGAAAATVGGNFIIGPSGVVSVGGNAGSITVGGNVSSAGRIFVSGNWAGLTVNGAGATGSMTLSASGTIAVGQNLGNVALGGSLVIGPSAKILVGANLASMTLGGNLDTSLGGKIQVSGNVGMLTVSGVVQGNGRQDIVVGNDLAQLTVFGGGSGRFGLQGVTIAVAKNLQGLDIRNGISYSLITAGVLIDGGTPGTGSNSWNIGPDGKVAILDSEIRSGFEIRNVTIGGDVESDLPRNSATGRPTRIVAGEDLNGIFLSGGIIDNFQIVGRLIDAVLAASVQPYGGTGAEPPIPTPSNYTSPTSTSDDDGFKTYDKPAGSIVVSSVTYPKYTAPPYDPTGDPTIDDLVLPGGDINPSFTPAVIGSSAQPSKSTVLGGVVATTLGNNTDFAGIFAANTKGVFVGPLPSL